MKVFLTGSTGFVGLNTLAALVNEGHEVHVYVRASSDKKYIEKFNPHIHEGELNDLETMTKAMKGMDAVIHTAGNTSCFSRDFGTLYNVNVIGTKTIVDAAIASGVKRIVYTSTTSTIGGGISSEALADETTPLSGFRAKSPYGRSKLLAEKEIYRAHCHGIETIILNPAEIIGAYDHNFQWGRLVMAVFANQVPFLPPGAGSFCSAEDVANAHVAALTEGESGQRYILAGDNREYVNMLSIIAEKLDVQFDMPNINYWLLYIKESCKEKCYPLFGKNAPIEPYRIRVFGGRYFYSSEKAKKALGYRTRTLEEMLEQSIGWYKTNGVLQ